MMEADWARWDAIELPHGGKFNYWNEPYAEVYDWYPWLRRFYTQREINYDCKEAWHWTRENSPWLPILVCMGYLAFCYVGPKVMANRKPFDLRRPLIAWNFMLSAFSFVGMMRTVPHLVQILYVYGFKYTICAKPTMWYGSGAVGMWTQAFVFSKIPELGDTIFVVLRKKPLIFLHWYHHVTVLLYCWHSYFEQTTYGLYFISMNYTVHALMYLYYGLAGMRIRLCKPHYITTMQISQMVVGIAVCVAGGYYMAMGETKFISMPNFQAGVLMYFSYMLLFLQYALGRFLPKAGKSKVSKGGGGSVAGKPKTAATGDGGAGAASSVDRKPRSKAE
ncbi:unnamed protein product [Ectocarpus sp. 12 AP-2014]